ncbi:MAG: hypothetical protein RL270_544, partial [Actinomycetota bacterium]
QQHKLQKHTKSLLARDAKLSLLDLFEMSAR